MRLLLAALCSWSLFAPTSAQTLSQPYSGDRDATVTPKTPPASYGATLAPYSNCGAGALLLGAAVPLPAAFIVGDTEQIPVTKSLAKGDTICIGESYAYTGAAPAPVPAQPATRSALATVVYTPAVAAPTSPPTSTFKMNTPIFAAVAGLDLSGASSTDTKAVFHTTAVIDVPLTSASDWLPKTNTFWLGGQIRIAGMAQPGNLTGNIGSLSSFGSYLATAVNSTPDKIVQSIETSVGVAYQFQSWRPGTSDPTKTSGVIDSLDTGTPPSTGGVASTYPTYVTLSLLLNVGAITPLSADQANPPVYTVTNQIYQIYGPTSFPTSPPIPSSCNPQASSPTACYVSFVPEDRTRFYRHYEGGFRLKIYGRDWTDNEYRFPAIADLTFGQNEYVTGGKATSVVLHLGGWVPVPKVDAAYIFGSMDTTLGRNTSGAQLVLTPAPSSTNLTYSSPNVYQIAVPQPNRDRYMFGFGVDLYHLITKLTNK